MTEHYWQRYQQLISLEPLNRKDPFWQGIRQHFQRQQDPKHHLELYSMCRSDNPYIRQVRSSPNITHETVSELICRDKACELQYCLSLLGISQENKRKQIDLKGCREQYETMRNCINVERTNLVRREEELRNVVLGLDQKQKSGQVQVPVPVPVKVQEKIEEKVYM